MTQVQIARLVIDLTEQGLVTSYGEYGMTIGESYPREVWLTPDGRAEVENWIVTDQATESIPVAPSTFINTTFNSPVQGSPIVIGSGRTTISTQSMFATDVAALVDKARELLATQVPFAEVNEEVEADLDTLQR